MTAISLSSILPGRTDRAFLTGQTGSGKTTLARYLLASRKYVVVLDSKGLLKWPEYHVERSLKRVIVAGDSGKYDKLIYRPSYAESVDEFLINKFFQWCYMRANCTVYVDETSAVVQGDIYPHYYGACLMRGREKELEFWSATQRPMKIPQIAMSEAEHVYCFRLRLPQDRKRVSDLTSIPMEAISYLQKREFIYAPQDGDVSGPFTLNLEGGAYPAAAPPLVQEAGL